MSLTGRNTLSLRKKDVMQQKQAGAAYKRLVFAHKATLGDTGINLTALVQPTEMATLGFVNPGTAELLAAKMLFYKKNLTVVSSAKGVLIQDLSYTVPTNERIAFQGFTAEADEIFTCVLESSVRDGLQVVDAISISATGDLAIGDTDFNVGTPFEVGKNITTQMGAVLVFRDGVLQARNTSNGTSGGNYQEIDAGGGLGSIIRFNDAPVSEASSIIVVSNGMVAERPTGSIMAVVESLAGQMDQVIPTVAALAGQPKTNFQGAPNNVDLKNFGDTVQDHENRIDILEGLVPSRIAYLKDVKPSGTDGGTFNSGSYQTRTLNTQEGDLTFCSLSSNQFTLSPGTYQVEAQSMAYKVNRHKIKLRNITDSIDAIIGISSDVDSTSTTVTGARLMGTLVVSSTKTFELQHRCQTSSAAAGFGIASSFGDDEIFSVVKITKVE
jgi:hypothetical protein